SRRRVRARRRSGATTSLRGGEQLTGPQHHVKPGASLRKPPRERGQGGAEPVWGGRRPRTAPEVLERELVNLPAGGARDGRKGVGGTREALLGPGSAAREACAPITNAREVAGGREGVGGVVVVTTAGTTEPGSSEGPLLHRCTTRAKRGSGECP